MDLYGIVCAYVKLRSALGNDFSLLLLECLEWHQGLALSCSDHARNAERPIIIVFNTLFSKEQKKKERGMLIMKM